MTQSNDHGGALPIWTMGEAPTFLEREAFAWLQETGALNGARHVWTNAYFTTDQGRSCETDLVVLGDDFLTVIEIKSKRGLLDLDGAHWQITDDGSTESIGQPHQQADLAAKKLKGILARHFPNIYVGYSVLLPRATADSVPPGLVNLVFGRRDSGLRPADDLCGLARKWRHSCAADEVERRLNELLTPAKREPAAQVAKRASEVKQQGEGAQSQGARKSARPPALNSEEVERLAAELAAGAKALDETLEAAGLAAPGGDVEQRLVAVQLLVASQCFGWSELRDHVLKLDLADRRHLRRAAKRFLALTELGQQATKWLCRTLVEANLRGLGLKRLVDLPLPSDLDLALHRTLERNAARDEKIHLEERRHRLPAVVRKRLDVAVELLRANLELEAVPRASLDAKSLLLASKNVVKLVDVADGVRSVEQSIAEAASHWPVGTIDRDGVSERSDRELLELLPTTGTSARMLATKLLATLRQRMAVERGAIAAVPAELRRHLEPDRDSVGEILLLLDWLDSLGAKPGTREILADASQRELAVALASIQLEEIDPARDLPAAVADALLGLDEDFRAAFTTLLGQLAGSPWPIPPEAWTDHQKEVVELLITALDRLAASGSWPADVAIPGGVSVLDLGSVVAGLEQHSKATIERLESAPEVREEVATLIPTLRTVAQLQKLTPNGNSETRALRILERQLSHLGWRVVQVGEPKEQNRREDIESVMEVARGNPAGVALDAQQQISKARSLESVPEPAPAPFAPSSPPQIYTVVQQILHVYTPPPSTTGGPADHGPHWPSGGISPRSFGSETSSRSRLDHTHEGGAGPRRSPIPWGQGLPSKLIDCVSATAGRNELWLVEGDSAVGTSRQARNSHYQAVLPLRGKILNVQSARPSEMLANAECAAIIQTIGAGSGPTFDLAAMRYGKVVIATDSDVGGAHARCLLLTLFARHMWPVLAAGRLYVSVPPRHRVDVMGSDAPIYAHNDAELRRILREVGASGERVSRVQRFKALGELNAERLSEIIMHPATRALRRITLGDRETADRTLELLMGDDVVARRDFVIANAGRVERASLDF